MFNIIARGEDLENLIHLCTVALLVRKLLADACAFSKKLRAFFIVLNFRFIPRDKKMASIERSRSLATAGGSPPESMCVETEGERERESLPVVRDRCYRHINGEPKHRSCRTWCTV